MKLVMLTDEIHLINLFHSVGQMAASVIVLHINLENVTERQSSSVVQSLSTASLLINGKVDG